MAGTGHQDLICGVELFQGKCTLLYRDSQLTAVASFAALSFFCSRECTVMKSVCVFAVSIQCGYSKVNSCAKRISIYNPRPISENGKELSRLIQEEAIYICKAMDELETFRKKPTLLREYCSRLHEIENQADDVYEFFITKLFEEEKDCIELIKIKEIMHELEKTTDAAEHVGKILKNLIVKYA